MNNTFSQPTLSIPRKIYYFLFIVLFSASFSFQSCNPAKGMVDQDQYSIDQNEILKLDAISLMKRGTKSFSAMKTEIMDFKAKVDDQIQYEKDRGPKNDQTVKMWELMMDPTKNLLGGFLSRWETEGKLTGIFVKETAKVVSSNFDKIMKLEKKKRRP